MSSDVEQALQRARTHLQNSSLEGLEAVRALAEAAVHASGQTMDSTDSLTGQIQGQIEDLISTLRGNASFVMPRAIADPLSQAVDAEIRRWEERAKDDPDARLVLRAFLGMRELLWEFSKRGDGPPGPVASRPKRPPETAQPPTRERVQRFDIED